MAGVSTVTGGVAAMSARHHRLRVRVGIPLLAVYAVGLAVIAFWPEPVDRGASGLLRAIARVVPLLTYPVVEFTANVLLFVPLGILLAFALPRARLWVVPIALAVTGCIEAAQGLFLAARTPSLADVLANTLGAAIGLAVAVVVERLARR